MKFGNFELKTCNFNIFDNKVQKFLTFKQDGVTMKGFILIHLLKVNSHMGVIFMINMINCHFVIIIHIWNIFLVNS
jgi:hypothetical protein